MHRQHLIDPMQHLARTVQPATRCRPVRFLSRTATVVHAPAHMAGLGLRLRDTDDQPRGGSRGAASASCRTLADRHDRPAIAAASLHGPTRARTGRRAGAQKTTRPSIAIPSSRLSSRRSSSIRSYVRAACTSWCASGVIAVARITSAPSSPFPAATGAGSLFTSAHPRRRTGAMRLGALRFDQHRQGDRPLMAS